MEYVCSKCGHRLTPEEYAGCPECGHRGRRRADVRFVEPQAVDSEILQPREPVAAAGREDAPQLSELPRVQRVRTANYLAAYLGGSGLGVGLGVLGWEGVWGRDFWPHSALHVPPHR